MTLQLVTDDYQPDGHSVRVPLTEECLADLEQITRHVLAPADLGVAELRNAIVNRDRDAAVVACRRLLAVGLVARDIYRVIEKEPA